MGNSLLFGLDGLDKKGRLQTMRRQIIEAKTAQECLRLSNTAEAVLSVFKIAGALIEDQNRIARMKVDAERIRMRPSHSGRWMPSGCANRRTTSKISR